MKNITIVTGNIGKLRELEAMAMGRLDFVMHDMDIVEIQSMDLREIVEDKLKKAYEQIKGPVIVDDVSAGVESLKGLPGPFIKFFEKTLGGDALLKLAKKEGEPVTIRCVAAYYDGKKMLFGEGVTKGVVVAPRGHEGFGFDPIILADGQTRTFGEMTTEEKSLISHRGKAFRALLKQIYV